jgi:hypothetical protein
MNKKKIINLEKQYVHQLTIKLLKIDNIIVKQLKGNLRQAACNFYKCSFLRKN